MKLPKAIRDQFRAHGRTGGRARAAAMDPEARRSVARLAAIRRWTRERFGNSSFEALGLPGGDIVDSGLTALARGDITPESLVVAEAAPRLRREGVPVPNVSIEEPSERLYTLLEQRHGDMAHARFLALLDRVHLFADTCGSVRRGGHRDA
jgi:hypothetical protein